MSPPFLLGYYYADGRYGDHFYDQAAYTNAYRSSLSGWHGFEDPVASAAAGARRAVGFGKSIWLALDMGRGSPWREHLRAHLAIDGAAEKIVAIELRDEPPWNEDQAASKAASVRRVLGGWLPDVPLGVTLSREDVINNGRARIFTTAAGYGYVAGECYLDVRQWEPEEARAEAGAIVRRLRRNTPRSVALWVVGQSYDRNGEGWAFGPPAALEAIQGATYEAAKGVGAAGLFWFSYGRPGGVETYGRLRREHRAIGRAEGILL